MSTYFWNVLLTLDQAANVLLSPALNLMVKEGGAAFGDPDETLSSVMGKNYRSRTCRGCILFCKLLHWLDREHCEKSIESDEGAAR